MRTKTGRAEIVSILVFTILIVLTAECCLAKWARSVPGLEPAQLMTFQCATVCNKARVVRSISSSFRRIFGSTIVRRPEKQSISGAEYFRCYDVSLVSIIAAFRSKKIASTRRSSLFVIGSVSVARFRY